MPSCVIFQGGKGCTPVHGYNRVHLEVPGVRGEDEGGGGGPAARHVHQAHQLLRGLAPACQGTSSGGCSSKILSEVVDVPRARWLPFLLHDVHGLCVLCLLLSFIRDIRCSCVRYSTCSSYRNQDLKVNTLQVDALILVSVPTCLWLEYV